MSKHRINWPKIVQWVEDPKIIQQEFNRCQYFERIQRGELRNTVLKSKHRSPPTEPDCTLSQVLVYWDMKSNPVAIVHQYMRPNGTIGCSGQPDPKRVVVGDKVLALRVKAHQIKK